jgi:hypothetical protein
MLVVMTSMRILRSAAADETDDCWVPPHVLASHEVLPWHGMMLDGRE